MNETCELLMQSLTRRL